MVAHTFHPSYTGGEGRRIKVQAGPGKNIKPYLKSKYSKKGLQS
jgi:hypothetical protein